MSRYVFAPRARQDLLAIWEHIALQNFEPSAADKQLDRFYDKFALLAMYPGIGQARDDLRPGVRAFSARAM